jgi:hypothetical protein
MSASGVEDFYRAAGALRGADKTVLGELAKSMRTVARPVVGAVRDEVRKSPSQGRQGSSAVVRQLHAVSRARTLHHEGTGLLVERRVRALQRKLVKVSSLRESIASATGLTVSTKTNAVNLTFRVRSGGMPPGQRKLVKRWNRASGWKHPVFGNRTGWVRQVGRPYFDKTITERRDVVRAGVLVAMQAAAEKIVHPDAGAQP